jgi:hypothetical protein
VMQLFIGGAYAATGLGTNLEVVHVYWRIGELGVEEQANGFIVGYHLEMSVSDYILEGERRAYVDNYAFKWLDIIILDCVTFYREMFFPRDQPVQKFLDNFIRGTRRLVDSIDGMLNFRLNLF